MALKTSPLHEYHLEYGVKMAPVGNWTLPLHFENGIAAEAQQCVNGLALFDLCGSGKFRLAGKAADLDAHFSPAPSALKIGETGRFLQGNSDCVRLLRMAEDDFLMITSPLSPQPVIQAVEVQDLTPIFARLLLVGNDAAELLKNLGADNLPAENHWSKISVDGINAIAFEGKWEDEYKEYQIQEDDIFTNAAGEEEQARMLKETGIHYFENDGATGFMKYYEGEEYAFVAILPKEEGAIEDYVADMTADDYIEFWNSYTTEYDVVTKLPCFTYSYDLTLNDALKDMGMPTAFTEGNADFSLMVTNPEVNLYISNVIHKTYIKLDEKGTEAAAVTAVEMANESCAEPVEREVKEVILDRPFVYAIVDVESGMPMFIGTVNSVE